VWLYARKVRPTGAVSGLFLAGYGVMRFAAEFVREPDDYLGLSQGLSRGQQLSIPMIICGVALMVWAYKKRKST
jgi:phosphatidylglycerol:prolipoprotein diacylglycerol transferase